MLAFATLILASTHSSGPSAALSAGQIGVKHACANGPCAVLAEFRIQSVGRKKKGRSTKQLKSDGPKQRIGPGHCTKGKFWNKTTKTCVSP